MDNPPIPLLSSTASVIVASVDAAASEDLSSAEETGLPKPKPVEPNFDGPAEANAPKPGEGCAEADDVDAWLNAGLLFA